MINSINYFLFLSVLVIGGYDNMKTTFTCNKADALWTKTETPNILSAEESRTFFLSFANNLLKLGRVGGEALFTHQIECPVDVAFIGIGSGKNRVIDWTFCGYGELDFHFHLYFHYCHFHSLSLSLSLRLRRRRRRRRTLRLTLTLRSRLSLSLLALALYLSLLLLLLLLLIPTLTKHFRLTLHFHLHFHQYTYTLTLILYTYNTYTYFRN